MLNAWESKLRSLTLFLALFVSSCTFQTNNSRLTRLVSWEAPTQQESGDEIAKASLIEYDIYRVEADNDGNVTKTIEKIATVNATLTSTFVTFDSLPATIAMTVKDVDGVSKFSNVQTYSY